MSNLDRSFWTGLGVRVVDPTAIAQVGALCLRDGKSGPEVLLVKSSRGRWIIPKGWPMDGHTDAETAKIEAWEEAGLRKGKVSKAPIGGYVTEKRFDDGRVATCHVSVYRIDVKEMTKTYPEATLRKRKWVSLSKAAKKVDDLGLKALLQALK
ncbi:8-oxo-dGTP pyrophosphatase MutT (NUDIX family) [Yoonia maricola]|uniref:8-oxo-dGTP pyrophosphatase MutT (NUDIX family) n=1 Tax=Yoonia maricola TaxID=420999 RepID=A0A2M8W258_9RHOB|nr:NUDIX hydrolase [Yoonia maricola]PJI84988.1 8-oxo-dGTP pyrophosphatase MutT (NUDIX family) [Yoonia maricola]